MSAEAVHVSILGRVQAVGYREFARRAAERCGVAGFVRNRADGTVEARLVGATVAVEATLAELRRGPPHARVAGVEILSRGPAPAETEFTIQVSV